MPEVLMENTVWRRQDIEHTTAKVITFYAHELALLGVARWTKFTTGVIAAVRGESVSDAILDAPGFSLLFIGPKPSLKPVIREEGVVWQTAEPRIVLLDGTYGYLAPSDRSRLYHVSEAIAEEVEDTYRLDISHDPFSFIFPKQEYAEVDLARVTLLG